MTESEQTFETPEQARAKTIPSETNSQISTETTLPSVSNVTIQTVKKDPNQSSRNPLAAPMREQVRPPRDGAPRPPFNERGGDRPQRSDSRPEGRSNDRGDRNDRGPRDSNRDNRGPRPDRGPIRRSQHGRPTPIQGPVYEAPAFQFTPKPGEEPVKVGSLLGLQQVGQCIFLEYKDDIIIVDAGLEFAADDTMGADYIVPDISYLKARKDKIRGILLTHGHLDHIGALRDMLPELDFPMIYTTPLTIGLVKKTFDNKDDVRKIKYKIVDTDVEIVKTGCFTTEFVRVNHNIPETYALSIHTPKGVVFTSGDFKIDYTPAIDKPADLAKMARIGTEGVKLFIGDSLGSTRKGAAISEKVIGDNLAELIRTIKGRMIIATFASNVGRIIQIVEAAIRANKIVFLSGRSMVNNVEICQELGYINVPKDMIRKLDRDISSIADDRVLILSTGAQGEEFSSLARLARDEHNFVRLKHGDNILMSATTIPGNEKTVQAMMNNLVVRGVNIITNDEMDIHASGHGGMEDHKMILGLLRPDFFMPFYTEPLMRYAYRKLAMDMGFDEEKIMMPKENGAIIELYDEGVRIAPKGLELSVVLVDGKGKGHLSGEYVIKARQIMAQSGIVSLIFKIDAKGLDLVGNIQIESRGFVYSNEVKQMHTDIVNMARKKYEIYIKRTKNIKDVLRRIKDEIALEIKKMIDREPMVVPMYVYINRDGMDSLEAESVDDHIVGMSLEEQGSSHSDGVSEGGSEGGF